MPQSLNESLNSDLLGRDQRQIKPLDWKKKGSFLKRCVFCVCVCVCVYVYVCVCVCVCVSRSVVSDYLRPHGL